MKNALTIDVEDWYMTQDLNFPYATWGNYEDRIEYSTRLLIDMLAEFNIKATFFVLGCVAFKHPSLIQTIVQQGHELASHGYTHTMVSKMSKEEFRADLVRSKQVLEDRSGVCVNMFRAPTWSISENSLWALEVLEEEGFLYDSSIQPFKTHLSGMAQAPMDFYHPKVKDKTLCLLEMPPGVASFGSLRFPFAGGLYFRVLPYFAVKRLMAMVNEKRPAITYFHPWEVDPKQPRLAVNPLAKITHYYNLENNLVDIKRFLQDFQFVPIGKLIAEEMKYPVFQVC